MGEILTGAVVFGIGLFIGWKAKKNGVRAESHTISAPLQKWVNRENETAEFIMFDRSKEIFEGNPNSTIDDILM